MVLHDVDIEYESNFYMVKKVKHVILFMVIHVRLVMVT